MSDRGIGDAAGPSDPQSCIHPDNGCMVLMGIPFLGHVLVEKAKRRDPPCANMKYSGIVMTISIFGFRIIEGSRAARPSTLLIACKYGYFH